MVYIGSEDLLPFPLLQWPLPGLLLGVDPTLLLSGAKRWFIALFTFAWFENRGRKRRFAATLCNGMPPEAFARTFFPAENPLGKTFGMGATGEVAEAGFVVIGVVGDSKYRSLREPLLPIFYTPMGHPYADDVFSYLYVRTVGRPEGIVRAVREALFEREARLPIMNVETMQEQVNDSLWQERLLVALAVMFSGVSVLLAGLGLYGLLAYDATQRKREFGIRVAVGAQRSDVGQLMIGELMGILAPGLVAGGVGCVLVARVITPALYGIGPYDAAAWSGALLAVLGIGALAVWQPMYRAMRADPAEVLREE